MRAAALVTLRVTNSIAAARTLVVEQDARAGVQAVALAVVDGDVVAEHLGAPVRRARMERRHLGLRGLAHLAEHLRRRRLVEADRVVLRAADHADRLEHPQHAEPGDVRRQLGLAEAQRDERDRPEVVHLVGLSQLEGRDQRGQVGEIARDLLDERHVLEHLVGLRVRLALHHAVHVVAAAVQELGQVLAVLSGDPGDEGTRHVGEFSLSSGPPVRRPWASLGRRCTSRRQRRFAVA